MRDNRFPGNKSDHQKFKQDHRAMEELIHPNPFFPYHVMERLSFYREKLLPAYKYLIKHNGVETKSESKIASLSGELFYQFIFSRGKDDLALLKTWKVKTISPRFSNHYQNLKGVEQRSSYFSFCSTLFQQDPAISPKPAINSGERGSQKPKAPSLESPKPSPGKKVLTP